MQLCWREPGRKRCKSAQRRSVSTRTRSKGRELARDLGSGTGKLLGILDLIAPSPASPTPLQAREFQSHLLQRIFFGNARRSHDRPRWCLIEAGSSILRLGLQCFNSLLELAERLLQGGSLKRFLAVCRQNLLARVLPHSGVDLLHGWRCTFRCSRGREKHLDCSRPPCKS